MQNDQDLIAKHTELEHSFELLMQKKAELQALLEAVPFAVFITGFDFSFQFCNQNTFSLLGYEKPLSDQDFIANHVFGNRLDKWKIQYDNVLTNNTSSFEMTLVNKDNKPIDVSVHSHKAIFGGKSCSVNYLRDISIQKAIERDLKNEQKKTNLIIDSIPAMVFIKDKENRFCRVNKAFEEQTGLKNENIIQKSGFDLAKEKVLGSDDWEDDKEVIETGIAKRNIIEPLLTDKHRWFLTDKIPYKNIDGEVIGIIGFSTDISERMHAEEELLRSEKMFRLLFETSPDGIILSSLDGKILSTNQAIENLLGYSSDEIRKLTNSDLTPKSWLKTELATINEALQNSENVRSFEKEYLRKDKVVIPALVTIWIIYNEDGTPVQLGTYVKDLSIERKAAELEKSLYKKEKEQLEKDLDSKNRELNLKITKLIEVNA
jgi:PAS domain S-box-containing protein